MRRTERVENDDTLPYGNAVRSKKRKCGVNAAKIEFGVYRQTESPLCGGFFVNKILKVFLLTNRVIVI